MRCTVLIAMSLAMAAALAQDDPAVYITASDTSRFSPASALSPIAAPGKWFQRQVGFAARGDYILLAQAGASYPDLTVDPGLRGRYHLYVNLREIDRVTGLQLKLSGEELAHTITPALGTETVHTNRDILWATDVDLTGQTILMRYLGHVVYFSYLKFVPVAEEAPDLTVDPERVRREPLWDVREEWARTQQDVPEGMVELKYLPRQPATPATDDGRGYVITSRPYLDLIFPNTVPAAEDVVSELRLAAAPGEYEPITFAVHAFRDLGTCEVGVSDLSDGPNTIGRAAIDIASVVCRNLRTTFRGKVYMHAPALLHSGGTPTIPAGRTQQFWLTVQVPPDTPAGDYSGTITVTPEHGPPSELSLILRVYPFELPEPRNVSLGMYDQLWSAAAHETWLADRFADMRAHGMNTVGYCGDLNGRIELQDATAGVVFDGTSRFEQVMAAYHEAGFPRPLLWLMGSEPWRWCSQQAEPGSERFEALYREVIQSILRESDRRGWPGVVFQPIDEPGSYGHRDSADYLERWAVQSRLISEAGGTVEVDHIPLSTEDPRLKDALERALPHIDIFTQRFTTRPIWFERDGWWWDSMKTQAAEWGRELWSYNINNANFFPELATLRLAFGVFVWQQQVGGQLMWAYQSAAGNPLNCLDDTHTDMMYTWPAMPEAGFAGGPSLMWECIREGVDDLRYLQALESAIAQAEADGRQVQAQPARELLTRLAASFDLEQLRATNNYIECQWEHADASTVSGSFNVPIGWELTDYDRHRREIAEQIGRLGGGR